MDTDSQPVVSLWFQVEQEIANFLISKLENHEITPEHAAQIAKFVVKSIPTQMTDQQMMQIIPSLDDEFVELASIVLGHLKDYRDKNESQVQATVEEYLKQGQFQKASDLMQQYFQKKL